MKLVIKMILAAVVLAALSFNTALAAGTSPGTNVNMIPSAAVEDAIPVYTIEELGMTVQIPADLIVFTRHIDPNDPNPALFDLTKENLENYFIAHDIYLNAVALKVTHEINIFMLNRSEIQETMDFGTYTDSELQAFIDNSGDIYKQPDVTYIQTEIDDTHPQVKFIKSYFERPNGTYPAYGVQYYTIHNGMVIDITLMSYDKPITADREALIHGVINSVRFEQADLPVVSSTVPSTEPSVSSVPTDEPSVSNIPSASAVPSVQTSSPTTTTSPTVDPEDEQTAVTDLILRILLCLVATFLITTVPIIIYRHVIRKRLVFKRTAWKIAVIYGAALCVITILVSILIGVYYAIVGTILWSIIISFILWSIVNYFILACGYYEPPNARGPKSDESAEGDADGLEHEADAIDDSKNIICQKCSAVNLADSKLCFFCGIKLNDDATRVQNTADNKDIDEEQTEQDADVLNDAQEKPAQDDTTQDDTTRDDTTRDDTAENSSFEDETTQEKPED